MASPISSVFAIAVLLITAGCDKTPQRIKEANYEISVFKEALEAYRMDFNALPTTREGLAVLVTPSTSSGTWPGPYMALSLSPDPWGRPYVYQSPAADGAPYALLSLGPDGLPGTADDIQ